MVKPALQRARFLAPGDKLGKHELIRQIAVGGMAELYLARTMGIEEFEKLVVVKRILPQYANNANFVNMFLNEARLAATLHHPSIAQVYDIGQEQGEYFFSMEYVHGEDLGSVLRASVDNGVPISLDAALTLVTGLCAGLHHAHDKAAPDGRPLNVVHRDVSPSNVLLSYDGNVKLVDFGIARANTTPASTSGGLKGKISYMSPEQCRGNVMLDRRSDLFSVGTIMYELTTGQLPFNDPTEYAILNMIVNRDAAPPSTIVAGYPPALEAIVMKALSRDPDRRFNSALELQEQLENFAHDNRLRISPLVVSRLMSTLFPQRLEEWANARAQGAFFVEQHVVRTLIEQSRTDGQALPDGVVPVADAAIAPDETTDVVSKNALEDAPTGVQTPLDLVVPPPAPPHRPTPPPGASRAAFSGGPMSLAPHRPTPTPPPGGSRAAPSGGPVSLAPPPRAKTPFPAQLRQTQVGVASGVPEVKRPTPTPVRASVPTPIPNGVPIMPAQPGIMISNSGPHPAPAIPAAIPVSTPGIGELTMRVRIAAPKKSKAPWIVLAVLAAGAAAGATFFVLDRDDGKPQVPETTKPLVDVSLPKAAKPDEAKVEAGKPDEVKVEAGKPDEPKPEVKDEPKPEVKDEPKPEVKDEPKPAVKDDVKDEAVDPPKPDPKKKPPKKPPQTVKKPKPKSADKPKPPDPKPDPTKDPAWKNGDSPFMPVRPDKR